MLGGGITGNISNRATGGETLRGGGGEGGGRTTEMPVIIREEDRNKERYEEE